MKCTSCGGRLAGTMTFCPFCGVRQDVNLRQIHFRDLGTDASLPCPHCTTPLGVIEFDTEPKVRIERCTACFGNFFNPGELEVLLDATDEITLYPAPGSVEVRLRGRDPDFVVTPPPPEPAEAPPERNSAACL